MQVLAHAPATAPLVCALRVLLVIISIYSQGFTDILQHSTTIRL